MSNSPASKEIPVAEPDIESFDIDAWLDGDEQQINAVVQVTRDLALAKQIGDLDDRIDYLRAQAGTVDRREDGTPKPRRMAAPSAAAAQLVRATEEHDALLKELQGTWLYVSLRPLSLTEERELTLEVGNTAGRLAATLAIVATVGTAPEAEGRQMDAARWDQFLTRIGITQSRRIEQALIELSYGRVVTPDFSQPVSTSPDGQISS